MTWLQKMIAAANERFGGTEKTGLTLESSEAEFLEFMQKTPRASEVNTMISENEVIKGLTTKLKELEDIDFSKLPTSETMTTAISEAMSKLFVGEDGNFKHDLIEAFVASKIEASIGTLKGTLETSIADLKTSLTTEISNLKTGASGGANPNGDGTPGGEGEGTPPNGDDKGRTVNMSDMFKKPIIPGLAGIV